jgi:ketosteroid isomerase-like protein
VGNLIGVQVVTGKQNRHIAGIIFSSLNNRELSLLGNYLDENATFDFPGTKLIQGRKRILTFFKILFRKYPRLTFKVEGTLAEGEQVCILWTNEGFNSKGLPYSNRGMTFVALKEGKIHFISDYFKNTSFTNSSSLNPSKADDD